MLNKQDEKIFLDLDDEITFVVERIRDAEADRIVLVAPEGAGVISSLVSLKLLAKLVFKIGKSLVLVTMDEGARKFAKKVGVPVIKRVVDLNESLWLASENKLRKRGLNPVLGRNDQNLEDKDSSEKSLDVDLKESVSEVDGNNVVDSTLTSIDQEGASEDVEVDDFVSQDSDVGGSETLEELEGELPSFLKDKNGVETEVGIESELKDFGFVVGEDVAKIDLGIIEKKPQKILEKRAYVSDFVAEEEGKKDDLNAVGRDMSGYELKEPVREKFKPKRLFGRIKFKFPKLSIKSFVPVFAVLILLFGVLGVYSYFIAPKATLTALVKYETISLEQEILASLDITDVDLENLEIPLIIQEVEESGSDSRLATGSEVRGDKSKGKITLVNKTEDILQLSNGVVLTGFGYKFLLLENEEISAADIFAGTLGRAEVDVEAYDIGEEYNLDSGIEFSVEGYTTAALVGKSFEAFSGGTKEDVTVVTAEDRDSLKESLEGDLKDRVKNKVKAQVGEGFEIRDEMIDVETIEEIYDVEAGAEADGVNLNIKVRARAYVYYLDDIKTLGNQLLISNVASGLKLLEDQSEYTGDFIRRDGDNAVLNMKAVGAISGDITEESIKDSVLGKTSEDVEAFMSSLDSITSYELTLGPSWLPKSFLHVPKIKGNIEVELSKDVTEDSSEVDE